MECCAHSCIWNLHAQNYIVAGPHEEHLSLVTACKLFHSLFIPPYKFPSGRQRQISQIAGAVWFLSRAEAPGWPPRATAPWQSGWLVGSELGLRFPNSYFLKAVTQPGQSRHSHGHLGTTAFFETSRALWPPRWYFLNYTGRLAQTTSPQPPSPSSS